jgi:hypothetical protein
VNWTVTWRLARKFARAGAARSAAAWLGAVAALLVLTFTVLGALGLSRSQLAERELGPFDASVQLPVALTTDTALVEDAASTLRAQGASATSWDLTSLDVRVRGAADELLVFHESDWSRHDLTRYTLTEGDWPREPGQVLVSEAVMPLVAGSHLTVFSGATEFEVVGTARDAFAEDGRFLLAAPGTWASQDWEQISRAYPNAAATAIVYWTGVPAAAGVEALAWFVPEADRPSMAISLTDRAQILAMPEASLVGTYPTAFVVPSILFPVLISALALISGERRLRRSMGILRMIGVNRRSATIGALGATSALVILASALGVAIGAIVGFVARPVVAWLAPQPLSPYQAPVSAGMQIVALVALTVVVVLLALTIAQRRVRAATLTAFRLPPRAMTFTRQLALALAAVAVVWSAVMVEDLFDSIILAATSTLLVILATPTLVRWSCSRLRETGPVRRLAKRQLQDNSTRVTAAVALVVAAVGPALAMLTLISSVQATTSEQLASRVPPDQLLIESSSLFTAPPAEVVDIARNAMPAASAHQLYALGAEGSMVTFSKDGLGIVRAVDGPQDAAVLCDGLDDNALAALQGGGVLVIKGTSTSASIPLWEGPASPTAELDAASAACPGWSKSTAAITLVKTAQQLGLTVSPSAWLLAPVTREESEQVVAAVEAQGYPAALLTFDAGLQSVKIPVAAWAAVAVTCLLALIGITLSARNQAHALRSYEPGLRALGLGRGWTQSVLRREILTTTSIGLALALVAAFIPVFIAAARLPDTIVRPPWFLVGALVAASLLLTEASGRLAQSRPKRQGPVRRRI